jgi:hypothetical protein
MDNGQIYYGETWYYFQMDICGSVHTLAMILPFSHADKDLLTDSHLTLYVCRPLDEECLKVIDVKSIQSVVAMIPFPLKKEEESQPAIKEKFKNHVYVGEKLFFDLSLEGNAELSDESDDNDPDN